MQNLDEVKQEAERKCQLLSQEAADLDRKQQFFHQRLALVEQKFEQKKSILLANETFSQLTALELRLRTHEASNFSLRKG